MSRFRNKDNEIYNPKQNLKVNEGNSVQLKYIHRESTLSVAKLHLNQP